MALTGDEALVGRVLNDRYLIGERIARRDGKRLSGDRSATDRPVAIKVMHHGLGDDKQFTERFVREAKSAAKLNHPNVVSVFDQGMDGEVTYLVMEYVPGRTLRDIMREESPMPPHRALELLEQILIALSAAHAAHIIHRDVKPENVLITPDGKVKVADFGLARAVSAATTATGGTLIGTVSYLAPEIVVNEGADARSDVYACGAVLYEMLTGVKPHTGESPIQVAYKHVHEDIGKPSAVQDGIPPYVDALVARATVRDRDQRSTDARVMLQQVRSVLRALDAGLTDDPDLDNDLLPGGRTPEDDGDPTEVVPRLSAGAATGSSASDSAPTEAVHTSEPTMQWSREAENSAPAASKPVGLLPVMSPEDYKQIRANEPRSRRGRNLLVLSIVLAVLAALIGYYFGIGRYTDTPRLVGNPETSAKAAAERAGFTFHVADRVYSEKFDNGVVMSTFPKPGGKILPGGTIDAVISKGKHRTHLPKNLKGMTVDEATSALEAVNLKVGPETTQRYDEKVDKGLVIGAADYTVKNALRLGTVVNLVTSKGRKPIDVVDYTGKDATDAEAALKKAGFKVAVDSRFSDDVDKGLVISQDPRDGIKHKGDTIKLTVSKGQDLVEVPDVVGMKRLAAIRKLKAAGFVPVSVPLPFGNQVVKSQNPSDGKAKRGSIVYISHIDF